MPWGKLNVSYENSGWQTKTFLQGHPAQRLFNFTLYDLKPEKNYHISISSFITYQKMEGPATHTGPDGETTPLSTLLQHCPPTPPAPGIPPLSTTLRGHPWHWTYPGTWSAEAVRATPDPPPLDLHAAKRSVRAKKKNAIWYNENINYLKHILTIPTKYLKTYLHHT